MGDKHWFGPNSEQSKGKGHPIMFGFNEAEHFDSFPEGGGYPKRFLQKAFELMGVTHPDEVLHLCSGSMKSGITVDIRPETNPDYVCDARDTPFEDESFDFILIDPPYSYEYARNLYGTEEHYPKPGQLMKEACRLLRPGGKVGILHFQVPMIRKPLKIRHVIGITTGLGYNIRAFTVVEKLKEEGDDDEG